MTYFLKFSDYVHSLNSRRSTIAELRSLESIDVNVLMKIDRPDTRFWQNKYYDVYLWTRISLLQGLTKAHVERHGEHIEHIFFIYLSF